MRPGKIYVDGRVGSKELAPILSGPRHMIPTKVCELPSADFSFVCGHTKPNPFCRGDHGCTVGVERKVLSDMSSSLLKRRFDDQVRRMIDDYTMAWVVVEGIWRPGGDDAIEIPRMGSWIPARVPLTYSALSAWLVRYDVFARGRLARWRTSSTTETAAFISSLYHWWQKEWDKHKVEQISKTTPTMGPLKMLTFKPTQMQRTAASLPGVGTEAAKKVGRYFGSIGEMFAADVEEWRKAGLGKKQAEKVVAEISKVYRVRARL